MGYYSEVAIAFKKEVFLDLIVKNKVPELLQGRGFPYPQWDITESSKAKIFSISDIKWNSISMAEKEILDLFLLLDDEEFGFVRIGEEVNDIETSGDYYDYGLNYSTTLSIDTS